MRNFLLGLGAGLVIGLAGTAASAARIVGDTGYLMGWSVTVSGDEVCSDPYVWTATREIECD